MASGGKKAKTDKTEELEMESGDESGDENPERGNWTGKLDFLLSLLGYAVGLGNVWRFPYLCFKHGGGAFLIPYFLMLLFIGIPCFFLEIAIGQYAAVGPITLYNNLCPLFKGLGFANFYVSIMVALYYNMIMAVTIYYIFASFTSELPWADCGQSFNSEFCFSITDYKNCSEWRESGNFSGPNLIYHRGRCTNNETDFQAIRSNLNHYYGCKFEIKNYINPNDTCAGVFNTTEVPGIYINEIDCVEGSRFDEIKELFDIPRGKRITAAQEYLERSVLNQTDGLDDMGQVEWHLALCLLAAWIIIFLCLFKGIKSSGKVVYFTAIFPYVVLVILLIRAVTLPGAYTGIQYYIVPNFSRLNDIKVWEAAAIQIFFSLSVAGGGLTTLASYNKFHNNIVRDTLIVCFGNSMTSVFAGFAIFSILGFMAEELGVPVADVVKSGSGLAFIAYPDLVTRLPVSPLWAILFFFMLFTLGLDSQFAIVETILTGILDWKPNWRKFKTIIIGIVCALGFLFGLPMATGGGGYLVDLFDYYAAGWPYLFIGLCELIIIAYIYGIETFCDDLYHMVKFRPGLWIKTHFNFIYLTVSPLIIFVILAYSWSSHEPLTKGDYVYPEWADAIGWIIAMVAILAVPVAAIYQIVEKVFFDFKDISSYKERLKLTFEELLQHTPEWRENADRARIRDGKLERAEIESDVLNENSKTTTSGYTNRAMTSTDEAGSLSSKL